MSYRIRGYEFPWVNGHPHENLLKDILQKTLGDSTSNALDQIDMEKSTLSNMHKGKALSEEQFASVNDALDNYKQKINKMSEHNNIIYGSDGQVVYKPDFKVNINDDGHFINQKTGEQVNGNKLGRVTDSPAKKTTFDIYQGLSHDDKLEYLTKVRKGTSEDIGSILDDIDSLKRERDSALGRKKYSDEQVDKIKKLYEGKLDELEDDLKFFKDLEAKIAKDPLAAMKGGGETADMLGKHMEEFRTSKGYVKPNNSSDKVETVPQESSQRNEAPAKPKSAQQDRKAQKNPLENLSREELEEMIPKLESMRDGLQEEIDGLRKETSSKPNTSKIKVDDTKQQYHQQTETHNTQTTNPPPKPPNSTPDSASKPKADSTASNNRLPQTVKSNSNLDLKKASKFLEKNRGKIALGGLGFGVAKSLIDGEDDNMLSSAGKGVKAAVITSGASYAAEYAFKSKTVQDFVRGEVVDESKVVREISNTQRKSATKAGKLGTAYRIGMIALAGATTVDVLQRYGDKRDAEKLKKKQEWELKKKEKRMKEKNKEKSYGYIDDGDIVFEMFNARSGHHKMGNAKFY